MQPSCIVPHDVTYEKLTSQSNKSINMVDLKNKQKSDIQLS